MKKSKNPFTLVEIILAMGIIVVCITTIMGMLSYGISVSNDAVMQNYMTNVLEQVGDMVESHAVGGDISTRVTTGGSAAPYGTGSSVTAGQIKIKENNCTTPIDSNNPFLSNVYSSGSSIIDTIKIEHKTDINGTNAIDFTAYARLYINDTSKTVSTSDSTGSGTSLIYGSAPLTYETLFIQVTWPASKPYADRISEGNVLEYTKVLRP